MHRVNGCTRELIAGQVSTVRGRTYGEALTLTRGRRRGALDGAGEPVRRRIVVSLVGLTTLAVVVFGVPLGFAAERLYHDEEIQRIQREAAGAQ